MGGVRIYIFLANVLVLRATEVSRRDPIVVAAYGGAPHLGTYRPILHVALKSHRATAEKREIDVSTMGKHLKNARQNNTGSDCGRKIPPGRYTYRLI